MGDTYQDPDWGLSSKQGVERLGHPTLTARTRKPTPQRPNAIAVTGRWLLSVAVTGVPITSPPEVFCMAIVVPVTVTRMPNASSTATGTLEAAVASSALTPLEPSYR